MPILGKPEIGGLRHEARFPGDLQPSGPAFGRPKDSYGPKAQSGRASGNQAQEVVQRLY
jgi:hypothetical protein